MDNQERKQQLIEDIQNLLNTYKGVSPTSINPALLEFMDEDTLVNIIDSLLQQKDDVQKVDVDWLNQFKSEK